jgi:inhibitor of KinA sporulation pathway (predicted exonuclease)
MARQLDQIVVVDLESTCWEGDPPSGEESEIIEVGVCMLDTTLERGERDGILVRPERSHVSPFCTKLTTLTQADVDAGIPFHEACARITRKFGTRDRLFASYGDYDRRQFERQCRARHVAFPFGPTHLNVKNLAAVSLGLPKELAMDEALRALGMPLEGTHHRGIDDAYNIAAILARLLRAVRGEASLTTPR